MVAGGGEGVRDEGGRVMDEIERREESYGVYILQSVIQSRLKRATWMSTVRS